MTLTKKKKIKIIKNGADGRVHTANIIIERFHQVSDVMKL